MSTAVITAGGVDVAPLVRSAAVVPGAKAPAPRLRLTKRGRRVFTTLAALPLVIAAGAFVLNGGMANASGEASNAPIEYVTVEAGQTMWQLAEEIAPTADPRDVISDFAAYNQMGGSIQPGQRLAIPAKYTQD